MILETDQRNHNPKTSVGKNCCIDECPPSVLRPEETLISESSGTKGSRGP